MDTIDGILREHAARHPHKLAYRYLLDGESKEATITYGELHRAACRIASQMQKRGSEGPLLALLLFPSGLEFISAFFGCLYAGVVAVPAPIPKRIRSADRLKNILKDTNATYIVTDRTTYSELQKQSLFEDAEWIITDDSGEVNPFVKEHFTELAFLQYTSGSTSAPKGVMVSHQNLMANLKMVKEAFGHDESTIFVGWIPLFHDMGLVGTVLQPMYLGIPSTILSPVAFLQRPIRWLEAISKYKATSSGAPNFAFDLCVEKTTPEERKDLDLSSWRVAFNGAEPIRAASLKRFYEAFSSSGFKRSAFYPCYGLAECVVFAAGNPAGREPLLLTINRQMLEREHRAVATDSPSDSFTLVSVGKGWAGGEIAIVDPKNNATLKPGIVGEVWLKGPHVGLGYWNQPEASKKTFDQFLRTGDLGFCDEQGNLYITGRLKDLIIFRGRNIYPQDIELCVEECDARLRSHGCAAFSFIKEEEEHLVIVAEIEREKMRSLNAEELSLTIRQAISQEFQVNPIAIVFIKPNSLPKTSSGKVQRALCKAQYLDNTLESIAKIEGFSELVEEELNPLEVEIALEIKKNLSLASIAKATPLNSYGLDSMGTIALQVLIEKRWGTTLSFEEIMDGATVESLSKKVEENQISEKQDRKAQSGPFPLSYQQLGVWLDLQKARHSTAYNLAKCIEIFSPLDISRLQGALSHLMKRHELLRCCIGEELTIHASIDLPFTEISLDDSQVVDFLNQESTSPFNFEMGPLFKVWLITTQTKRKLLFIAAHHLIADLWSLGIFLEELFQIYNGEALPDLSVHYSDYIIEQQGVLKGEKALKGINYWKERIEDDYFTLPTSPSQSALGKHQTFALSAAQTKAIKEMALKENTTVYVLLLSAYFLLFYLYSGKQNQSIGTTLNGRSSPKWYSTFGMFAGPLPLSLSLSPEWSIQTLINHVKKIALEALGPYQLPLTFIQEKLQKSTQPFQTVFVYQQVPTLSKELNQLILPHVENLLPIQKGELSFAPFNWNAPISPFDLTLYMSESEGSLYGSLEYKSDLFDSQTILSLKDHFSTILDHCLQFKGSIADLHLETEDRLIKEDTISFSLIDLFANQVEKAPDHCVLFENARLMTYQELDRYSNGLARELIEKGVKPDDLVAIMLPHSIDLIAHLLAILKVGAAFLPVDPKTPPSRLETIMQDSHAIYLISNPLQGLSDAPLPRLSDGHSVAYVIYTSGSTGKPKGAAISHAALINYLITIQTHYSLPKEANFAFYSSLAFDLTLTSLFVPLLFGYKLTIFHEEEDKGFTLEKIVKDSEVTHLKLTPAHLKLLEDLRFEKSRLQQLIVGGEQLLHSLVINIYQKFNEKVTIINEYGPTEATIGCTYFIYPTEEASTHVLPIGSPIDNTSAYVLTPLLHRAPFSIEGELYLSGINLAYGYWKAPKLTAERFLPDPYLMGKRIYKTGDLAKRDSTLHCLGRLDRQIKIRGHRIETEEVEVALKQSPLIKDCIVLAQEGHLCAYYISVDGQNVDLRDFLTPLLPSYMIPTAFIPCVSFPLTSNGKIDLKRLPTYREWMGRSHAYKAPRDSAQATLIEIWSEVLLLPPSEIGIGDPFFDLGGDSIKAMQIVSKARGKKIPFSVADLFKNPTIEALAEQIQKSASSIPFIISNKQPTLSPIQRWFFSHFSGHLHHYNQAVLLKRPEGFDPVLIITVFTHLFDHHDALRTLFPRQMATLGTDTSIPLSVYENGEDQEQCKREMHASLNIEKGPLVRLALFDKDLVIVIHHLLIDGVSWRILLEDFDTAYKQAMRKERIQLPEKTHSYFEWASRAKKSYPLASKLYPISRQKVESFTLSSATTRDLLRGANRAYNTQITDLLLTAFYLALGTSRVTVHLEGHGREDEQFDLTRTVGWFTDLKAVTLEAEDEGLSGVIQSIKENLRRSSKENSAPSIVFNYLGELSSTSYETFTYQPLLDHTIDPQGVSPYALQIDILIVDQQLFCRTVFYEETYNRITPLFAQKLNELIQHCIHQSSIVLPLLPTQQGILYHALQAPHSSAYFEQAVLHLEGDSNAVDWRRALEQLIATYDTLRAAFIYEGVKTPQQVIFKERSAPFYHEKGVDIQEYLRKDRQRGFHLSSDPLIRFALLEQEDSQFYLVISFHHLILDGWSLSLLFRSYLANLLQLPQAEAPSIQSYIHWYQNQNADEARAYWEELLLGYEEQVSLPKISQKGKSGIKKVSATFNIQKIELLAKKNGLTLSSLFHAFWFVLLSRYTRQRDLVFGTVFSGRDPLLDQVEKMAGLFIVTLPIRMQVEGKSSLIELAHLIQNQLLESERKAVIPLNEIHLLTPLKQNLFDHIFVFENYPFAGEVKRVVEESGLPFKFIHAELAEETHYDFLISFLPANDLKMEIQYNPDLYSSSFVNNIPRDLNGLIDAFLSHPQQAITEWEIISKEEKRGVSAFNQTESPYFNSTHLPALFKEQVKKGGDRIALIAGEMQISYQELDRRSDQLAHYLLSMGIQTEECVAIYYERSVEMIICWLAVLKAGAAYVPMDASYAPDRIETIAKNTGIRILLTSSTLALKLPALAATVVLVDQQWSLIEKASPKSFIEIEEEQLAYILFTSGSTGTPKGIAMSHKAICNHLSWIVEEFGLNATDRMLQLTSFSFDVSLCELYVLFAGGVLVLAPPEANRDVAVLLQTIEQQQVTFLQMVPSLLETLLDKEIVKRMASVRQLLCGADILKKEDLKKWYSLCSIPLTNLYGLTETCIDSTYFDCSTPFEEANIPIGRPFNNVESYVLDSEMHLLPKEIPGELYIGGLGLARGYYQRPDLTAERFLPHPFAEGERIYRTLDLAYWKPDHYLFYLGRIDQQIKIRGFRVELGEIESALYLFPFIKKVVLKVIGRDSQKSLCGYFTAEGQIEIPHLRKFLNDRLPYYMVPAHLIQLELFPLTSNGKIDGQALPIPKKESLNQPPQNKMEQQIKKMWEEVLKIDEHSIGIDHNFFDAGGTSMSLMQLHYRLSHSFQKKFPIEKLFEHTTIRSFAAYLGEKGEEKLEIDQLAIRAQKRQNRRRL